MSKCVCNIQPSPGWDGAVNINVNCNDRGWCQSLNLCELPFPHLQNREIKIAATQDCCGVQKDSPRMREVSMPAAAADSNPLQLYGSASHSWPSPKAECQRAWASPPWHHFISVQTIVLENQSTLTPVPWVVVLHFHGLQSPLWPLENSDNAKGNLRVWPPLIHMSLWD